MHLLILGFSSIVQRRVMPAALATPGITEITLASRSHADADYSDYDTALRESGADAVYVSGVNSEHETWIRRALERDLHVMVDKPALLTLEAAEAAVDLAKRRGRGLAEATVFAFHPQVETFASMLPAEEASSTRITAILSIPPRPPGDFRNRADLGGGSLYDLGPYAVATNRLVFGAEPEHVDCRVLTWSDGPPDHLRQGDGGPPKPPAKAEAGPRVRGNGAAGASEVPVDTSFSVLMTHANGGVLAGHFGFVTSYQNRISALTASRSVDVERFFTTLPDASCVLRVREGDHDRAVIVPAADSFAAFFEAFAQAIDRQDFTRFTTALVDDARLLARMRRVALEATAG